MLLWFERIESRTQRDSCVMWTGWGLVGGSLPVLADFRVVCRLRGKFPTFDEHCYLIMILQIEKNEITAHVRNRFNRTIILHLCDWCWALSLNYWLRVSGSIAPVRVVVNHTVFV